MLFLALLWRLCVILWTPVYIQNTEFIQSRMDVQVDQESDEPNLEFSHEWKVLGPFQIGTRGTRDRIRACEVPWLTSRK